MSNTPPFHLAADLRKGMWTVIPGEEWPMEIVMVSRVGPMWDEDDGEGPRRRTVRVRVGYLENVRYHDYREDALVPTY